MLIRAYQIDVRRLDVRKYHAILALLGATKAYTPELSCEKLFRDDLIFAFPPGYEGPATRDGFLNALKEGMFFITYPEGSTLQKILLQNLPEIEEMHHPLEGRTKQIIEHVMAGNACGVIPASFSKEAQETHLILGESILPVYHLVAVSANIEPESEVQELLHIVREVFGKEQEV